MENRFTWNNMCLFQQEFLISSYNYFSHLVRRSWRKEKEEKNVQSKHLNPIQCTLYDQTEAKKPKHVSAWQCICVQSKIHETWCEVGVKNSSVSHRYLTPANTYGMNYNIEAMYFLWVTVLRQGLSVSVTVCEFLCMLFSVLMDFLWVLRLPLTTPEKNK